MAISSQLNDLARESIQEMMETIDHCISFKKDSSWKTNTGILGVPAAVLMFSTIDALGSYYRGKAIEFPMNGNRKPEIIKRTDQHFYVLNGDLFEQSLTQPEIKVLYEIFRSKLVHNLALPANYWLDIGKDEDKFFERVEIEGVIKYVVRLKPLYLILKRAVEKFYPILDAVLDSSIVKNIEIAKNDISNFGVDIITNFNDSDSAHTNFVPALNSSGTTSTVNIFSKEISNFSHKQGKKY